MDKLLLVGATGMVGGACIDAMGARAFTILARREMRALPVDCTAIVAPSEDWPARVAETGPAVVINCLGTTIAQAGSQAAFRAVDYDLVLAVARAAKDAGAKHFISVSSVGASAKGGNFYLRTKGEVEGELRALNFVRLDIIRPGLLTGQRGGAWRPGESIGMALAPLTDALMIGGMRRYRSIPAATVARAMAALAAAGGSGAHVHEHDKIIQLAD